MDKRFTKQSEAVDDKGLKIPLVKSWFKKLADHYNESKERETAELEADQGISFSNFIKGIFSGRDKKFERTNSNWVDQAVDEQRAKKMISDQHKLKQLNEVDKTEFFIVVASRFKDAGERLLRFISGQHESSVPEVSVAEVMYKDDQADGSLEKINKTPSIEYAPPYDFAFQGKAVNSKKKIYDRSQQNFTPSVIGLGSIDDFDHPSEFKTQPIITNDGPLKVISYKPRFRDVLFAGSVGSSKRRQETAPVPGRTDKVIGVTSALRLSAKKRQIVAEIKQLNQIKNELEIEQIELENEVEVMKQVIMKFDGMPSSSIFSATPMASRDQPTFKKAEAEVVDNHKSHQNLGQAAVRSLETPIKTSIDKNNSKLSDENSHQKTSNTTFIPSDSFEDLVFEKLKKPDTKSSKSMPSDGLFVGRTSRDRQPSSLDDKLVSKLNNNSSQPSKVRAETRQHRVNPEQQSNFGFKTTKMPRQSVTYNQGASSVGEIISARNDADTVNFTANQELDSPRDRVAPLGLMGFFIIVTIVVGLLIISAV